MKLNKTTLVALGIVLLCICGAAFLAESRIAHRVIPTQTNVADRSLSNAIDEFLRRHANDLRPGAREVLISSLDQKDYESSNVQFRLMQWNLQFRLMQWNLAVKSLEERSISLREFLERERSLMDAIDKLMDKQ